LWVGALLSLLLVVSLAPVRADEASQFISLPKSYGIHTSDLRWAIA